MSEVRNAFEGTLRWVRASGSGSAWATAASVTGTGGSDTGDWGLIGFVTNFRYTSAQTVETISERGHPSHHKQVDYQPPTLSFDVQWGITGQYPTWKITGSGASTPMIHLELKSTAPEAGAAIYHQFMGVVLNSQDFTEGNPANTQTWNLKALAMMVTASGYLG
jgi:hypothetical protein